jgi:8-oxo-dGTP pyrophosphatase MutT (NUDIX family)
VTDPHDSPASLTAGEYRRLDSTEIYRGRVIGLHRDTVRMPGGGIAVRDVVRHPGAVGVVAVNDRDELLMLRQYRHPVRSILWELPAGLLDIPGEPALVAAQRELAEEAFLTADQWHVLVDVHSSPGMTDEAVRLFLAKGIHEIPAAERHVGEDEEADMERHWVPLDTAVQRALAGEITNNLAVVGVLAADALQRPGREPRPAEARWQAKPDLAG